MSCGCLGRTKIHLGETLIYCNRPSQLLVAQAMLVDIVTRKVWLTWRPSHEVCPHFIVHALREYMSNVRKLLTKVWPSYHLVSARAILRELGLLATRATPSNRIIARIHPAIGCGRISHLLHCSVKVAALRPHT